MQNGLSTINHIINNVSHLNKRNKLHLFMGWFFLGICISFLFCLLTDMLGILPEIFRTSCVYMFIFVSTGASIRIIFWYQSETKNDIAVARLIEKQYPSLADNLSNVVALSKGYYHKTELSQYCVHEAQKTVSDNLNNCFNKHDFKKNPLFKLQKKIALVILSSFIFVAVLFPYQSHVSFLRIIYPTGFLARLGTFSVEPGNKKIVYGEAVHIRVNTIKKQPKITYRIGQGQWHTESIEKTSDAYEYNFNRVEKNITYFISGNHVISPRYYITVLERPVIGTMHIQLSYPSYTGIKKTSLFETNGNIEAMRGTNVFLQAATNTSIKSAFLIYRSTRIPMSISKKIETTFTIDQEGAYHIELQNKKGLSNKPAHHLITIIPDEPPTIEIIKPTGKIQHELRQKLAIRYKCFDDFGITRIAIAYRINKQKQKRVEIMGYKGRKIDTVFNWPIYNHGIRYGDTVKCVLEAYDAYPYAAPGRKATSKQFVIHIEDRKKQLKKQTEETGLIQKHIEKLIKKQKKAIEYTDMLTTNKLLDKKTIESIMEMQNNVLLDFDLLEKKVTDRIDLFRKQTSQDIFTTQSYQMIAEDMKHLKETTLKKIIAFSKEAKNSTTNEQEKNTLKHIWEKQKLFLQYLNRLSVLHKYIQKRNESLSVMEKIDSFYQTLSHSLETAQTDNIITQIYKMKYELTAIQKHLSELYKTSSLDTAQDGHSTFDIEKLSKQLSLLEKFEKSIKQGDNENAKKLLEEMKDTMEVLKRYFSFFEKQKSTGTHNFLGYTSQLIKNLLRIISEQELVLEQTNTINDKRIEFLIRKQQKSHSEILYQYKELETKLRDSIKKIKQNVPEEKKHAYIKTLDLISLKLKECNDTASQKSLSMHRDTVRKNMRNYEDVFRSAPYILLSPLDEKESTRLIIKKTKKIFFDFEEELDAIEEKIHMLSYVSAEELGKTIKNQCLILAKKEKDIEKKVSLMIEDITQNQSETFFLSNEVISLFYLIPPLLKDASSYLTDIMIEAALQKESETMQHLYTLRDIIREKQETLKSSLSIKMNTTISVTETQKDRIFRKKGETTGHVKEGYVVFPKETEYTVPPEYRQIIMKSAKEQKPKEYEFLIDEYYRRITE